MSEHDHSRRDVHPIWKWLTFLAIIIGLYLRWDHLGRQSLWFDEGYTAWLVQNPATKIIEYVRADTSPPLYYLLMHAWVKAFGVSEFALRSFSALLMSFTFLIALDIAGRFIKSPAAVAVVAWALAFSYFQVQFAKEARAYALMAYLAVISMETLCRHLASRHRKALFSLTIFLTAALYTHNMMAVYLLAFVPLWLILPSQHSTSRRLIDGAIVAVAVAILYSPWAIFCLHAQIQMIHQSFWVPIPDSQTIQRFFGSLLGVWQIFGWDFLANHHIHTMSLREHMGLALVILSSVVAWRARKKQVLALLLMGVFPPMLVAAYSLVSTPIFMEKTFLASAIFLPILVLLPLDLSWSKRWRARVFAFGVLIVIFMAGTLFTWRTEEKENWRGAAAVVAGFPDHRRLIVFSGNDGELPFDYYYHYRADEKMTGSPTGFFDREPPRAMMKVTAPEDVDRLKSEIKAGKYDEVVLVAAHSDWSDSNRYTLHLLENDFPNEKEYPLNYLSVFRFTR